MNMMMIMILTIIFCKVKTELFNLILI